MAHSKTNQGLQLLGEFGKWLANGNSSRDSLNTEVAKEALNFFGVNHRGWRLFLDYHQTLKSSLFGLLIFRGQPFASVENLAAYLVLLQQCEMDVIPPADFEKAWVTSASLDSYSHIGEVPVELFRAAWKGYVASQNVEKDRNEFFETDLPVVTSWYFGSSQEMNPSSGQFLKQGWSAIVVKAVEWKVRCIHGYEKAPADWRGVMGESFVINGVHVKELLSAKSVDEEGEAMHHCIDMYIDRCQKGEYRVVSFRDPVTEERLATLGLIRKLDRWEFDDLCMFENEEPTKDLEKIAEQLIQSINLRVASGLKFEMPENLRILVGTMRWVASDGYSSFEDIASLTLGEFHKYNDDLFGIITLSNLYVGYLFVLDDLNVDREYEREKMIGFKNLEELRVVVRKGSNYPLALAA